MAPPIMNCVRNEAHQPNAPSSVHQIDSTVHLHGNMQMQTSNTTCQTAKDSPQVAIAIS